MCERYVACGAEGVSIRGPLIPIQLHHMRCLPQFQAFLETAHFLNPPPLTHNPKVQKALDFFFFEKKKKFRILEEEFHNIAARSFGNTS